MTDLTHAPCCSSHGVDMDCATYRRTHFVEVGPCCGAWPVPDHEANGSVVWSRECLGPDCGLSMQVSAEDPAGVPIRIPRPDDGPCGLCGADCGPWSPTCIPATDDNGEDL